jgi:putative effector of murein hydrolase
MALTSDQKSSRLFKKLLGASETLTTRDFFEEPRLGKTSILPTQIWAEANQIPIPAPTLTNAQIEGVVQYFEKLSLTHIPGSGGKAFYHVSLKNSITFNFDTGGTYNYALYKSDGTTVIPFGESDWLIDNEAGVLTFYGATLPSGVSDVLPPQVSFYKYVGALGLPSGSTAGLNVHDSVKYATTGQTDATYSTGTSGFTTLPSNVDEATSFNEGDRILIKNQVTGYENGVYVVSGTTLVRAQDSNGTPFGEVSLNDYVFVTSGATNIATSWVIGSSSSLNPQGYITVGVDTQIWTIFSASKAYTADGNALKLNSSIFSVDLNDTEFSGTTFHNYNSGLYQSVDGLRIATPVVTDILTLSATTETLTSNILSLETIIDGAVTGLTSLETTISTEISNRLSGDTSLTTVINNLSGVTTQTAGSGLTYNTLEQSLNVNVDGVTIEISGDTLQITTSYTNSLETAIENSVTGLTSLETVISSNTSNISLLSGETSSLSTAISTEISNRLSGDTSLTTVINNLSGVTTQTAGSGLTYNTLEQSLNVNVDGYTIKIVNDELRGAQTWIQSTYSANITSGTTGSTGLVLTYEPITPVQATINGIEYLISVTTASQTNMPFYFDAYPAIQGSTLYFDASEGGFGIESGIDLIVIKYSYIDIT